jgi:hypothetical protein
VVSRDDKLARAAYMRAIDYHRERVIALAAAGR